LLLALGAFASNAFGAEPTFCDESPTARAGSVSLGKASRGRLDGAEKLTTGPSVRLLPVRHARRCLNWGTARLVQAIAHAGAQVAERFPGSPPLGVGDLSKAKGGPIPYSHSHQSGRDADLAFYTTNEDGQPVPAEDLVLFDAKGHSERHGLWFDAKRTWLLVRALLEDQSIHVQWLFISRPLRDALLAQARDERAPEALVHRAEEVLHQPSDAPPHADHLHLRIRCSDEEARLGCRS
jgi:penicillin-insensitive murein endopeptidase